MFALACKRRWTEARPIFRAFAVADGPLPSMRVTISTPPLRRRSPTTNTPPCATDWSVLLSIAWPGGRHQFWKIDPPTLTSRHPRHLDQFSRRRRAGWRGSLPAQISIRSASATARSAKAPCGTERGIYYAKDPRTGHQLGSQTLSRGSSTVFPTNRSQTPP